MLLFLGFLSTIVVSSHAGSPALDTAPLEDVLGSLRTNRTFRSSEVAVQVVDLQTGEEVWSHNADVLLNPASTTKILTAATALKTLGPSYVFSTKIYASVPPNGAGTIDGDLIVVGGGDPTLVVEKLWKIARDLELSGIKKITGDIVLDESFFGPDHRLPGWEKKRDAERGPSYFPALSALSLNFNTVAIVVRPGPEPGKPAIVELETDAGSYIQVESTVTTAAAGTRSSIEVHREVQKSSMSFAVEGSVPQDDRVRRYYRTVGNPTKYFGEALKVLLRDRGVRVAGSARIGALPDDAEYLTQMRSPPLTNVLMTMNKYSSNFMAEQVLRTIGAEMSEEGTTAAGLKEVGAYLTSIGVKPTEFRIFNGSGLAREGRLSPAVLTAVLTDMKHDHKVGSEFASSLSIAGRDGTLRRRLTSDPARLRGKTGTLDGVHCLTGYVEGGDGTMYAFAFLVNGFRGGSGRVKQLHNDFARRIFEVTTDAAASK